MGPWHKAPWLLSGYAAALVYWSFTLASVLANPWFSFLSNALSDLGGPLAQRPELYNMGLIAAGLLTGLYSVAIIFYGRGKLEALGGAYLSVASAFLALIGLFPAGTRPHVFISTYFFVQAFVAVLVLAVALLRRRMRAGLLLLLLFAMAFAGALVRWPSVALEESYEIVLLIAFVAIYNRAAASRP